MAKIGFRHQMFGFNKDDVNLYIEKLHLERKLSQQAQLKKEEELADALKQKEEALVALTLEHNEALSKLNYYKGKEEEIEKTSISIATMYLVAKQNADEMLSSAKIAAEEIMSVSKSQLALADTTDEKLSEIRKSLLDSTSRFDSEIKRVTDQLQSAKENIKSQLQKLEKKPEIELLEEKDINNV